MLGRRSALLTLLGLGAGPRMAMRPTSQQPFYVVVVAGGAGSGVFVYSPVAGAGNLIASIAPAAGTDPYGNAYKRGLVSYTSVAFSLLDGGNINLGIVGAAGLPSSLFADATGGNNGVLQVASGKAVLANAQSFVTLRDSQATGVPTVVVANTSADSALTTAMLEVQGVMQTTGLNDVIAGGDILAAVGNLIANTAGSGVKIKEGSNAKQGTVNLNGTTAVVVANTSITANSRIQLTIQSPAGANPPGAPYVSAKVAGTSFSVKSTVALDTSTVAYFITEPA